MAFKISNPDDSRDVRDMTLAKLFAMDVDSREKMIRDWMSEADTIALESVNTFKAKYNKKWVTVKAGVGNYPLKFALFLYNKYGPGHETRYGSQLSDVKQFVDEPQEVETKTRKRNVVRESEEPAAGE
ncbi:MAG: hypothetical protein PHV11_06300 [Candidatus Bipolaricaulis sp.]|nr:hypothetical protein [Candidatus Bipolaricaulis sp.]